jgi:hypothetical protein
MTAQQQAWAHSFIGKLMRVSPQDDRFKGAEQTRFPVVSFTAGARGRGVWFTLQHELQPSVYRKMPHA